jgi:hypothetical protein
MLSLILSGDRNHSADIDEGGEELVFYLAIPLTNLVGGVSRGVR